MDKKNFPLNTKVKFVKTTGKLDNQTGQILGKAIVSIEDHYIVLLDIPTEEYRAVVITEHCLEEMRFKIGDRVCDREDGDVGVIKEEHPNGWWVLWETGDDAGERLWLSESEMTLVENNE